MKKVLLMAAMAAFFLSSCKKESKNPVTPAPKKYAVSFNASDFSKTVTSSNTGGLKVNGLKTEAVANIGTYADVFYYYVFDSNGKEVSFLNQKSTDSTFGLIADSLAAGNYTVVMAAGKSNLLAHNMDPLDIGYNTPSLSKGYFYFQNVSLSGSSSNPPTYQINTTDVFFKNFAITVTTTGFSQNIVLERVVGGLDIKFLDAIPANANSIDVIINGDTYLYKFDEAHAGDNTQAGGGGRVISTLIPAVVKGTTNYTLNNFVLNTVYPFTVTIVCYDAAKNVLVTNTIPNVTCQKNVKTILTGNLFGHSTTIPVTIHAAWNTNTINF